MTDEYYTIACLPATAGANGAIITTVRLSGEFDLGACADLRAAVLGAIATGDSTRIVIDFADVAFIDSETVRVLFDGYAAACRHGLRYELVRARGVVQRVLDIVGLSALTGPDRPDRLSPSAL